MDDSCEHEHVCVCVTLQYLLPVPDANLGLLQLLLIITLESHGEMQSCRVSLNVGSPTPPLEFESVHALLRSKQKLGTQNSSTAAHPVN